MVRRIHPEELPVSTAHLTDADTDRAQQIWDEYAAGHDLTNRKGQAAGIDPQSGRIWFGESAIDIVAQMEAADEFRPLFFVRVGYPTYLRKGGRH
jgi:hypothetical protein